MTTTHDDPLSLEQQRDAEPVTCAECGSTLADRLDISPTSGIERYGEAFCDWPCANAWGAERLNRLYMNNALPSDWRER